MKSVSNVYLPSSTTLLPSDVWSKILSHLPPTELSNASTILNLPFEVVESAARIAVESMILVAARYFREHPLEDDFDTKELERLATQPVECEQTSTTTTTRATASQIRKSFGSYKDQTFQGIYQDIHKVIEYLSRLRFLKDHSKTIAIAVHSTFLMFSSDDDWDRDEQEKNTASRNVLAIGLI